MHQVTEKEELHYRNDINGLRAIGAIIILLGHFDPRGLFPSAYLAIDLFFVISGYLITSIVVRDMRTGNFSFLRFYVRRTLRIFPAMIVVLIAVATIGYFWMLTDEFTLLGRQMKAASLFLTNFVLSENAGYFDVDSERKALLHYWSLALEEQFYLFIPLVIWFFHRFLKIRHLVYLFAAGIMTSLAIYCWMIPGQQDQAYFLPQSRVWELLVGCLLGVLQIKFKASKYINFISAAAIASMIFLFQQSWTFRYGAPLLSFLTTAVTVAVLMCGQSSFNKKFLCWKPFVYLGLISYPIYLWHWPLLVFDRIFNNERLPSHSGFIVLVTLTLALSVLTFHLIERPIQRVKTKKITAAICCFILALVGIVGHAISQEKLLPKTNTPELKAITSARYDRDYTYRPAMVKSVVKVGKSETETLFIGDSVIEQYYPRVKKLVESNSSISAAFITTGGCPPIPEIYGHGGASCAARFKAAFAQAARPEVKTIVIGASWATYFFDYSTLYWFRNESDTLNKPDILQKSFAEFENFVMTLRQGKKVFLVLPVPVGRAFDPLSMLNRNFPFGRPEIIQTTFDQAKFKEKIKPITDELSRIAKVTGAELLDPMKSLCDTQLCATTADGEPIYRDEIHMRATYARNHAGFIDLTLGPQ